MLIRKLYHRMNDAAVPAEFLSAAATGPLAHASATVSLTC